MPDGLVEARMVTGSHSHFMSGLLAIVPLSLWVFPPSATPGFSAHLLSLKNGCATPPKYPPSPSCYTHSSVTFSIQRQKTFLLKMVWPLEAKGHMESTTF